MGPPGYKGDIGDPGMDGISGVPGAPGNQGYSKHELRSRQMFIVDNIIVGFKGEKGARGSPGAPAGLIGGRMSYGPLLSATAAGGMRGKNSRILETPLIKVS